MPKTASHPQPNGRATRQDVARAAGVSLTTVTHALNATPGARVSQKTRERVQRVAQELGYRPNFVGRALVTGKTFTVGVLQPSHDHMFSAFYQQMILGLVRSMEPEDYHPLILFRDDEFRYMKVVTQGRVDGMVVLQSDLSTKYIQPAIDSGIPTVVMNKGFDVASYANAGCVHSDHRRMMYEMVDEFVGLGCRSILEINDHRSCDANQQMFEAFLEAVEQHADKGIAGSTLIPFKRDCRKQLRNALAAGQRWDGVFVDGVQYAEQFLEETGRVGLKAGQDFHLISSSCLDGQTTAERWEASAYTHQPETVGMAAWDVLQRLIKNEAGERQVLVPYGYYPVRVAAAKE